MKWGIICLLLIYVFLTQSTTVTGEILFDTELNVTPEHRLGIYNSTDGILVWSSPYAQIVGNQDETQVQITILSVDDKVDLEINFGIIAYIRYAVSPSMGEGYIIGMRSFETTYHQNDSLVVYFQWHLLEQFNKSYYEEYVDGWGSCDISGGCIVIPEYFISLQLTSYDRLWNESVSLAITGSLGSRTQAISPDQGIVVDRLSGFDGYSTVSSTNYSFLFPSVFLVAVILRRKYK